MMVQITTDQSGPKIICQTCNKAMASLNGYAKHMKKHEQPGGFCCDYCGDRFCLEELLKKHKDEKHKIHACQICWAIFFTVQEYREHLKNIHRSFDSSMCICGKCGMEFRTPQSARRHINTQCGQIRPHPCDECEAAFHTKYNLNQHKRIHSGEKNFYCNYCEKSFISKRGLVVHERSHTGEKPYMCNVCGKYFAHRSTINRHLAIHTGVKMIVCKCCEARFSRHSNLKDHRRARPDTCGLAIYDGIKKIKPNLTSISASQMSPQCPVVDIGKEPSKNESESDEISDYPPFEFPMDPDDSSDSNKLDVEPSSLEKFLTKTPIKIEEPPQEDFESYATFNDPSFEGPLVDIEKEPKSDGISGDPPFLASLDRFMTNISVKIEQEQIPTDTYISIENECFLRESSIEIKDEPLAEVKEEQPDVDQTNLPSIKPCRVILEDISLKYPILQVFISGLKRVERRRMLKSLCISSKKRIPISLFKRTYDCKFCEKIYRTKKSLRYHVRGKHNKTDVDLRVMLEKEETEIPSGGVHRCSICSEQYLRVEQLNIHIAYHGDDGSLIHKCPCICRMHFRTKDEAMQHAKIKHKSAIYCDVCEKYLETPESLSIHKQTHFEGTEHT